MLISQGMSPRHPLAELLPKLFTKLSKLKRSKVEVIKTGLNSIIISEDFKIPNKKEVLGQLEKLDTQKDNDVIKYFIDNILPLIFKSIFPNEPNQKVVLIKSLFNLISNAKAENIESLLNQPLLNIPAENIEFIIDFTKNYKDLVKLDVKDNITSWGKTESDWNTVSKKVEDGTAVAKDLFKLALKAEDKENCIDITEFKNLSNDLGFDLSSHRIHEIFTTAKGDVENILSKLTLTEKEFEKALKYLRKKAVKQALFSLGITPEILGIMLINLTLLLLLIFVFIFIGVKAFSLAGTFGSIVTSLGVSRNVSFEVIYLNYSSWRTRSNKQRNTRKLRQDES